MKSLQMGHAPRERVSWNTILWELSAKIKCHAPRERVSWNIQRRSLPFDISVTLHVSVWVEIELADQVAICDVRSRSTWACELKYQKLWTLRLQERHAPRERVSWNRACRPSCYLWCKVTLHVSVWVEIKERWVWKRKNMSRSTWACELKWIFQWIVLRLLCHAPRERVSWNLVCLIIIHNQYGHAPRERVSWNWIASRNQ